MSQRFLVVDDSLVSRMMVKTIIRDVDPDADILEAACGDDALANITKDSKFDIALIDFNMPGMDGLDLIKALSERISIPKTALLTANIQKHVKERAKALSVTFINKPIDEELIREFILN